MYDYGWDIKNNSYFISKKGANSEFLHIKGYI
jgi:hypothetical protein